MLILYDIAYIFFALCYLPFFLIKGKYHRGCLSRLGIFAQGAIDKLKGQKVIWLHTVSVGEAQAASILVKNLKREYPNFRLVISTVTATGNKIAKELIEPEDLVIYSPLDISFVVKKVIGIINPKLFIISETEIWPNLIINLTKKGIPLVLVNGRISPGSFKGYKIVRPFLKGILQSFNLFCMQTKEDGQRIIELGAQENKVKVTGNMKFDIQNSEFKIQDFDLELTEEEKVFIAGSTHPGEEKIILEVYKQLIENHPNLRLLIAPRHIERVVEIEKLILGFGLKPERVSQINLGQRTTNNPPTPRLPPSLKLRRTGRRRGEQRTILILDTIGQLKSVYALAEIVFIGGSLIRHGGQNPIEPAIFAKPILFGPYMFNFSKITEFFLNKKAAIMVKDAQQLRSSCVRLLNEPILRRTLGQRAKALVQKNTGASLRNLQFIKELL